MKVFSRLLILVCLVDLYLLDILDNFYSIHLLVLAIGFNIIILGIFIYYLIKEFITRKKHFLDLGFEEDIFEEIRSQHEHWF